MLEEINKMYFNQNHIYFKCWSTSISCRVHILKYLFLVCVSYQCVHVMSGITSWGLHYLSREQVMGWSLLLQPEDVKRMMSVKAWHRLIISNTKFQGRAPLSWDPGYSLVMIFIVSAIMTGARLVNRNVHFRSYHAIVGFERPCRSQKMPQVSNLTKNLDH